LNVPGATLTVVSNLLTPQSEYALSARVIAGTHEEKLDQIDRAIHELIEIKTIECVADKPGLQFLAVPHSKRHGFALSVTILVLLIVLVLLLGRHAEAAQRRGRQLAASDPNAAATFQLFTAF
jgi:hypothetical protein